MSTVSRYSSGSKWLHWIVALIVIPMVCFSFFLDDLPETVRGTGINLHKSFGLLVLFLMFLRLFWILKKGKPSLPASVPIWQRFAARMVQFFLYVALFVMPLAGWIMSTAANKVPSFFGLFTLPLPGVPANKALAKNMFEVHEIFAWIIIGLLVLHIAGALKHYMIDKDKVAQRMFPEK